MCNILLATGKPAEAMERFEQAVQVVDASQLSAEVKENNKQFHHFNAARVAIATGDLAKAKEKFASAVGFNQLPTINSALVRMKARQQKA
jgi:predicted ABC-type ATPase